MLKPNKKSVHLSDILPDHRVTIEWFTIAEIGSQTPVGITVEDYTTGEHKITTKEQRRDLVCESLTADLEWSDL